MSDQFSKTSFEDWYTSYTVIHFNPYRQRFAVIPDIFSGRAVLVPEESPAGEVFRLRAPDHPEVKEGRTEMENVT